MGGGWRCSQSSQRLLMLSRAEGLKPETRSTQNSSNVPQRSAEGREIALIAAVRGGPPPSRATPASARVPGATALVVLVVPVLLAVLLGHRLLLHGAHRVHVVLVGLVVVLLLLSLLRLRLLLLLVRLLRNGHDVRLLLLVRCLLGKLRLLHAVPHGHALHGGILLVVTAQAESKTAMSGRGARDIER